jgi:hypothetical protein
MSSDRKPRRWLRRILGAILALLLGAGGGLWLARDLPRRYVERILAERLGAEVRLGQLEIAGRREFVLRDLRVRHMKSEPRLESLRIERMDVASSPRLAGEGRFESLLFSGVEIRLGPSTLPPEAQEATEVHVGRLDVRDGKIIVTGEEEEARLVFAASFAGVGDRVQGTLSLRSDGFGFSPLVSLVRPTANDSAPGAAALGGAGVGVESFEMSVEVRDAGRRVDVTATSEATTIARAERSIRLQGFSLEASAERDERLGLVRVEAQPSIPGVASASLRAELDAETFAAKRVEAKLRDVEIETVLGFVPILPAGWLLEGTADLDVRGDEGANLICESKGRLRRFETLDTDGAVRTRRVDFSARGETAWPVPEDGPLMLAYDLRASSPEIVLSDRPNRVAGFDLVLAVEGDLDLRSPTLSGTTRADLSLSRAEGSVGDTPVPESLFPARMSLEGELSLSSPAAFDGRATIATADLGTVTTRGRVSADSGRAASLTWSWSGAELDRLVTLGAGTALPDRMTLRGRARAKGSLRGALADPSVAGTLWLDSVEAAAEQDGEAAVPAWAVHDVSCEAGFGRSPGETRIAVGPVRATGELAVPPLDPMRLTIDARGEVDPGAGTARVAAATVEAANLTRLDLSGRWDPRAAERVVGRVSAEAVTFKRLRELARPWIADLAPEYVLQGAVGGAFEGVLSADGGWIARGDLLMKELGFSSEDGARVVQGPDSEWEISLARGLPGESTTVEAHGRLGGALLLWGAVFGDFGAVTSDMKLTAQLGDGAWTSELEWALPEGVRVVGRLDSGADRPRGGPESAETKSPGPSGSDLTYGLVVEVPDLGAFFERYARTPLAESVPYLDRIEGAGTLHFRLDGVASEDRRTAAGALEVSDLHMRGLEGDTRVEGLQLGLPFELVWGPPAEDGTRPLSGEERTGSLRFDALSLGGIGFPPTSTDLTVRADSVGLEQPLRIPLMGGTLNLERLTLAKTTRAERRLESSVRLDKLSLRALTGALSGFPVDGELDGYFPRVSITNARLLVDGGGEISVFGGTVEVSDISGENLLSRFPKLKFSAAFSDIDLLDITRAFDFGAIHGVARGEVRDCELFGGIPVRFEAEIETIKTKGISQKINVKAVNNIVILGTGGKVTALDRGLHKFFDTFTYSKIGVRMSLRNDAFLLRGTERRGRRELFIKGRLPFPIDIVNVAPGQSVSFQTMLRRARNLDVSTTAPR